MFKVRHLRNKYHNFTIRLSCILTSFKHGQLQEQEDREYYFHHHRTLLSVMLFRCDGDGLVGGLLHLLTDNYFTKTMIMIMIMLCGGHII